MDLEPGTRLDVYEILSPLGAGGMGTVYRARDSRLGREVAIKFLTSPTLDDTITLNRFLREARAASSLNHPNIVTIHEVRETEVGVCIVMELVEGRTVRAVINERPPIGTVVRIGAQVAQALAVAHRAGIVHRDIKPENIIVRPDGYVKLLDFGLARIVPESILADSGLTMERTAAGMLMGTVRYMSPEQATGEPAEAPSDIFSLGLVLYELATGDHPFARDPGVGILRAIISQRAVSPSRLNPEIPSWLEAVILHALEPDARLRPTAAQIAATLTDPPDRAAGGALMAGGVRGRTHVVGRERECADLTSAFQQAAEGRGMMICVSGEPGIGKTTLVEEFLDGLAAGGAVFGVGRGRCSERLAGAEAYLPLLDMLESLIHTSGGDWARAMKLLAPSWYAQIVRISDGGNSSTIQPPEIKTSSPERLKRELAQFIQEASRDHPLVLMLDDVHWIDVSSIDILSYVAARLDQTRLLVLACYRPTELPPLHPFASLKLELEIRGQSREIALSGLERQAIDRYVTIQFANNRFPDEFGALIHDKTEGSPLFAFELLRYLRDKKIIVEQDGAWRLAQSLPDVARQVPESVRSMIERQIERLDEVTRRMLVCASVQGNEFDAAVVWRVVGINPVDVEERLDELERVHGLVRCIGERELPDGTPTLRYRFMHVLYQNALYLSLKPARKMELSGAVAQAMLSFHGDQSSQVAHELALLFDAARDFPRATEYFTRAARNAARVGASQESVLLARRGLRMLAMLPDAPDRARLELELQLVLGLSLTATRGYAAPEVEQAYTRARTLSEHVPDTLGRFRVLDGLWRFYTVKPNLVTSMELAEQLLELARSAGDRELLALAHSTFGTPCIHLGLFRVGLGHMTHALELYDPEQHQRNIALTGGELGVRCLSWMSFALWMLGYPDQALQRLRQAIERADRIAHPFTQAFAYSLAAWQYQYRREPPEVHRYADKALAISKEHVLGQWVPVASILKGWALAEEGQTAEGVVAMRDGLALFKTTGAELNRPHFLSMLAEAHLKVQECAEATAALDEAIELADRNKDRCWYPELLRLKGVAVLAASSDDAAAEQWLRRALDVAREYDARIQELRAAKSLSLLRQRQHRPAEAHDVLKAASEWFTEGFETPDLLDAQSQLAELATRA